MSRRKYAYSWEFRRAVTRELERVEQAIDWLDEQLERAQTRTLKDGLSERRRAQVKYARWLRRLLR